MIRRKPSGWSWMFGFRPRKRHAIGIVLIVSLAAIPACHRVPTEHVSDRNAGLSDTEKRATIEKMSSEYRKEYADVPELSVSELVNLMAKENVLLVDVRTPSEQAVSMIPSAVPRTVFENEKEKHRDQTIVTYCTIGYRSGKYAQELKKEGFRVFNLHGSVLAWTHAGRPMVDSKGAQTKRVHVYGAEWNLLPEGYTAAW